MNALGIAAAAAGVAATAPAVLRWLRVAQREHYLPGAVTRFASRWWRLAPFNAPLAGVAVLAAVASGFVAWAGFATAAVVAAGPIGLGMRGRTSPLAWTRRLRTLAGAWGLLEAGAVVIGAAAGGAGGAATAAAAAGIGAPLVVDAALALTRPLEGALASRFVARAARKLAKVRPRIVAITGSYGKTSTKGYVAHLLGVSFEALASPASYNNRAGLARTVNERLLPSTEVLVAEMGAYGPGEIAALCRFLPPEVSVITAIGPVHLERFGTLERTLAAKAEITEGARSVVLNVDDERLAGLADRLEAAGRRAVRCSGTDRMAPVAVLMAGAGAAPPPPGVAPPPPSAGAAPPSPGPGAAGCTLTCYVGGELVGSIEAPAANRPVAASNVACALGVALEMGVPAEAALARLASLPVPANRLQVYPAAAGYEIVDDTFNSNPAGAGLALDLLASVGPPGHRRVVVTPGMVELGAAQGRENECFATRCASVASHVVVVGRTNRRALLAGLAAAPPGSAEVVVAGDRDEAVAWVRAQLGEGDAVLYENDLPDHFP